jgi:serine/threonine-protein kinase
MSTGLLAGRFEVLRPLGAGGLASVVAARDRSTGAEVALKLLHPHLCSGSPASSR